MSREPGGLLIVQVIAQQNFRVAAVLRDALLESTAVTRAKFHQFPYPVQHIVHRLTQAGWHGGQGVVPIVAGQNFAITVQDLATTGRNRDNGNPVLICPGGKAFVAHHL